MDEALDLFPALRPLLGRRAGLLSGWPRQQLAIARALITEPRLLILDEPTEDIQPSVVAEIEQTIRQLTRRGGLSVLLVEQHVGFALDAANRCYVLAAGRVTAQGHRQGRRAGRRAGRDDHLSTSRSPGCRRSSLANVGRFDLQLSGNITRCWRPTRRCRV